MRQTESVSQRRTGILAPEQPAALQFRYDAFDEIIEALGNVGKHDVEAIACPFKKPLLHFVSNGGSGTNKRQPTIAAQPLRKLSDVQPLSFRQLDHPLTPALARVRFRDLRQRSIGIKT